MWVFRSWYIQGYYVVLYDGWEWKSLSLVVRYESSQFNYKTNFLRQCITDRDFLCEILSHIWLVDTVLKVFPLWSMKTMTKLEKFLFVVSSTRPFSDLFWIWVHLDGPTHQKLVCVLTLLVSLQQYSVFPSSDQKNTGYLSSCCLKTGAARDDDSLVIQLYGLLKPSTTI